VTPAVLTEPRSSVSFPIGQVEHPSALSKFDQVVAASKGKQIVVFLDYDGTLSPIVDDPDAAYMSDTVPTLLLGLPSASPVPLVCLPLTDHLFLLLVPRCGGRCAASPSTSPRRSSAAGAATRYDDGHYQSPNIMSPINRSMDRDRPVPCR